MPPYGMTPYGPPGGIMYGARHLPDDQQSIQSFHFDIDTRSEKRLNFMSNRPQSVAGGVAFKTEPADSKNFLNTTNVGLLTADDTRQASDFQQQNHLMNNTQLETANEQQMIIKREEVIHRMTPQLHQLPHVKGNFSLNSIVQIRANDPCEGQPALVDILNIGDIMEHYLTQTKLDSSLSDSEDSDTTNKEIKEEILYNYKLLQEYPGPLVKDRTSKAQLIQFCQKNVKECLSNVNLIDPQSHALLWDYLGLMVRQNGLVDLKTDISPLLLAGISDVQYHSTSTSVTKSQSINKLDPSQHPTQPQPNSNQLQAQQDFVLVNSSENSDTESSLLGKLSEEDLHLNKLRQMLGAGQRADAIEYAIKSNMWSHALFLSSSLNASNETKLLSKVKTRFIHSLQTNDPIHTCYQLLIGRVPTVVSNLSKSEWNEWRRHLAMIVSNVDESNKDLVLTTIKTMGDSLATNGRIAASHFCYLLANCQFGTFNKKSSKLVLIGSSHNQDFSKFCQLSAIQATEIFEFACQTTLESLIKYKLIYATRLLEYGMINEALKYVEVISSAINRNPRQHQDKFSNVFNLANRLIVYETDSNERDEYVEPQWLKELNNNYKSLYNLWHLIPTSESNENRSNNLDQQDTLSQQQQQKLITTINVNPKEEPKTAEPSPNYQIQNNDHVNQNFSNVNQLSLEINKLNLDSYENSNNVNNTPVNNEQQTFQHQPHEFQSKQNVDYETQQSMTFQPQFNQNDFNTMNNFQQPLQQQQIQQATQFYNPSLNENQSGYGQQPQHQQEQYAYQNQHVQHQYQSQQEQHNQYNQDNSHQDILYSQQQQYQYNQQLNGNHQEFDQQANNFPRTSRASSVSSYPQQQEQQQHSQPQQFYQPYQQDINSHQFSNNIQQNTYSRSRQSSTSTSYNENNLMNQQQPMFNPNEGSMMPRTHQTYPSNQSQIDEESTSTGLDDYDDYVSNSTRINNKYNNEDEQEEADDTLGAANPKKSNTNGINKNDPAKLDPSKQLANQGLLKRVFGYIMPANAPKAMKLPDDKKKTIVWDDKLKRYVNLEGGDEASSTIKPPPISLPSQVPSQSQFQPQPQLQSSTTNALPASRSSEMPNANQENQQPQAPPQTQTLNRFSLKNAGARTNYYAKIDVMAGQTKKAPQNVPAPSMPMLSNMPPPAQIPPRFFVPAASSQNQQSNSNDSHQQHQNFNT